MKKIDEAIIVEVQEKDPNFSENALAVEPVKEDSLFDQIFNLFFGPTQSYRPKRVQRAEPEPAYIVETNEVFVHEIYYASAEILDE